MAEGLFFKLRVLAFARTKLYKTLRVCAQGILKVAFDNKPP